MKVCKILPIKRLPCLNGSWHAFRKLWNEHHMSMPSQHTTHTHTDLNVKYNRGYDGNLVIE